MTNLIPQTDVFFQQERLNQQMAIATHFFNAKCFGGGVQNPEQLFVLIQAGAEMGLPPIAAVNSLYIVNGKITIYGMAMTKRLREAGWKISYDDSKQGELTATIEKDDEKYSYTATAAELQSMKSRAYSLAPKDKLKWHAISRLVRFYVPEITGGTISYIKEEVEDLPEFQMPEVKKEMASEVMIERLKKKSEDNLDRINSECGLTASDWDQISQEDAIRCLTTLTKKA